MYDSIHHFDPLNQLFLSFRPSFTLQEQIFDSKSSIRNYFFGDYLIQGMLSTCLIIWKQNHIWPLKMQLNVQSTPLLNIQITLDGLAEDETTSF